MLRVVRSSGRVSDRKVTFIRLFDPVRAAERALDVRSFRDLDPHPGLILKAGHIEPDGIVVITRHGPPREVAVPVPRPTDYAVSGGGRPAVLYGAASAIPRRSA